jgi:hypothetical protein
MHWWLMFGVLASGYPAYCFSKNWENKWLIVVAALVGLVICSVCMFGWAALTSFLSEENDARILILGATAGVFWGALVTLPCAWLGWWSAKKPKKPKSYTPPDPGIFKQEE